jgi:hypothetical protein
MRERRALRVSFCISLLCAGASRHARAPQSGPPPNISGPRRPPTDTRPQNAQRAKPATTRAERPANDNENTNPANTDTESPRQPPQHATSEHHRTQTTTNTNQQHDQTQHTSREKPANRNNRRRAADTPPHTNEDTPPQSRPGASPALCSLDGGGIMDECGGGHYLEPPCASPVLGDSFCRPSQRRRLPPERDSGA